MRKQIFLLLFIVLIMNAVPLSATPDASVWITEYLLAEGPDSYAVRITVRDNPSNYYEYTESEFFELRSLEDNTVLKRIHLETVHYTMVTDVDSPRYEEWDSETTHRHTGPEVDISGWFSLAKPVRTVPGCEISEGKITLTRSLEDGSLAFYFLADLAEADQIDLFNNKVPASLYAGEKRDYLVVRLGSPGSDLPFRQLVIVLPKGRLDTIFEDKPFKKGFRG